MTIKSCADCGGLYTTAPGEMFAGTPCRCTFPSSNEPLGTTADPSALPVDLQIDVIETDQDRESGNPIGPQWANIRAELLRLAARVQELERENGELHKAAARGALAQMKVEAELAALRKRFAEAPMPVTWEHIDGEIPVTRVTGFIAGHRDGHDIRITLDGETPTDEAKP